MAIILKALRKTINILLIALLVGCTNQKPDFDVIKFSFLKYGGKVVSYELNPQSDRINILQLRLNFIGYKDENNVYRNYIDTSIIYQDSILLDKKITKTLYKKIHKINYDSSITISTGRFGECGAFIFEKIQNYDTIKIICSCPRRTDSIFQQEYQLLDEFFNLAIRKTSNEKYDSLTKELYRDYEGKLQFNQKSKSPLEYEIIGAISGDNLERDSLLCIEFFKNLPKDKIILIDLTHTWIFDNLKDISDNVYFYGYPHISLSKEIYQKMRKEMDAFGNDSLWLNDNQYKYSEYGYLYHKYMYESWLKNRGENKFLTRDELIKTIANSKYK